MSEYDKKELENSKATEASTIKATIGSTADVQKRIYANKVNHGYNVTDIATEFCLLYSEVAEAVDAWKHGLGLSLKLADVAIYLLGIAEITGIDLGKAIDKKMAENEPRHYEIGSQEWYDHLSTEMKDYFMDGMK